jgi:hypothetical protein
MQRIRGEATLIPRSQHLMYLLALPCLTWDRIPPFYASCTVTSAPPLPRVLGSHLPSCSECLCSSPDTISSQCSAPVLSALLGSDMYAHLSFVSPPSFPVTSWAGVRVEVLGEHFLVFPIVSPSLSHSSIPTHDVTKLQQTQRCCTSSLFSLHLRVSARRPSWRLLCGLGFLTAVRLSHHLCIPTVPVHVSSPARTWPSPASS